MPRARAASQFTSRSSTNTHSLGPHAAEPLERELVDRRVGLAQADERGVHHQLEELVDLGQLRAPERLPLADVVREQRRAQAAAAQLADELDHLPVRLEALEVELAQPGEVEAGLQVRLDPVAELGLA